MAWPSRAGKCQLYAVSGLLGNLGRPRYSWTMDFATIVRKSAGAYADNVAVTCRDRHQTYRELYDRAARVANALSGLGLRPGDRVGLLGANAAETVEQIAGLALGGFV